MVEFKLPREGAGFDGGWWRPLKPLLGVEPEAWTVGGAGLSTLRSAPASRRAATAASSPLMQASMRAVKPWSLTVLILVGGRKGIAWIIRSWRPLVSILNAMSSLNRRRYSVSSVRFA